MISVAPLSRAMCSNLVPLVVVNTSVLPCINEEGYSKGELPCCSPSATLPSRSPAVMASICLPIRMHSATLSTGIMHLAPFSIALAIVDVARRMSMMTTTLLLTSYKCRRAGERIVYSAGFFFSGMCQQHFNPFGVLIRKREL